MKLLHKIKWTYLSTLLLIIGCAELDVPNPNQPDRSLLETDPQATTSLTSGAFFNVINGYTTSEFNLAVQDFFPVNTHLAWAADHTTMTNNYRAMWALFKAEPRVTFSNTLSFPHLDIISDPWQDWNASVASADLTIGALAEKTGRTDDETKALTMAYLSKGLALGHLGTIFNQAYVPNGDVNADPVSLLTDYPAVISNAITELDNCIALATSSSFTLVSGEYLDIAYTSDEIARLARSWAAHFLVCSARTPAENAATDWAKVKEYTSQGIQRDFIVDNQGFQVHDFQCLTSLEWYFRIDHRILRIFNPTFPKRYPTDPAAVITEDILTGDGYTGDKRLEAYYDYSENMGFWNLGRGPQLRSHYYETRYAQTLPFTTCIGTAVYMYVIANDLMLAEAEAMLGNLDAAKTILNDPSNPRKAIGEMPDVTSTVASEILSIIHDERDLELGRTTFGIEHSDARRRGILQAGVVLHMPVPADELTTLGLPLYTFGGVENADGLNTADGTNSWLND